MDAKGAQELFGSLSNRVVEVMAATPQQLAIESAEKAGLTKVSEKLKSMEASVEEADPLGIMDSGGVSTPAPAAREGSTPSAFFGSLSNRVVEVMAATPQQLAMESAEKAGLTKVSEKLKSMEASVEEADPLGIMDAGGVSTPAPAAREGGSSSVWNASWPTASWSAFGAAESSTAATPITSSVAAPSDERASQLEAAVAQLQQQLEVSSPNLPLQVWVHVRAGPNPCSPRVAGGESHRSAAA